MSCYPFGRSSTEPLGAWQPVAATGGQIALSSLPAHLRPLLRWRPKSLHRANSPSCWPLSPAEPLAPRAALSWQFAADDGTVSKARQQNDNGKHHHAGRRQNDDEQERLHVVVFVLVTNPVVTEHSGRSPGQRKRFERWNRRIRGFQALLKPLHAVQVWCTVVVQTKRVGKRTSARDSKQGAECHSSMRAGQQADRGSHRCGRRTFFRTWNSIFGGCRRRWMSTASLQRRTRRLPERRVPHREKPGKRPTF